MSYSVDNPQIAEVLDMASGEVITAHRAIGDEYDRAIQLRTELRMGIASGRPRYTCTLCGVGVYLNCMHFERRFYFKHAHEDGSCPIQTRGELTQDEIDVIRYNGVKESWSPANEGVDSRGARQGLGILRRCGRRQLDRSPYG